MNFSVNFFNNGTKIFRLVFKIQMIIINDQKIAQCVATNPSFITLVELFEIVGVAATAVGSAVESNHHTARRLYDHAIALADIDHVDRQGGGRVDHGRIVNEGRGARTKP